jgi:hypothetical protein
MIWKKLKILMELNMKKRMCLKNQNGVKGKEVKAKKGPMMTRATIECHWIIRFCLFLPSKI